MGQGRRGGNGDSLIALALSSDWRVAAFIALTTAIVGFAALPALFSGSVFLGAVGQAFRPLIWIVIAVFTGIAFFKFITSGVPRKSRNQPPLFAEPSERQARSQE